MIQVDDEDRAIVRSFESLQSPFFREETRPFDKRDYRPFTSGSRVWRNDHEWIRWKEREKEREKVEEGERASKLFPKSEVSGFEHDRLDTRSLSLPYASPLIWRLVSVGSVTKLDIN